MFTNCSVRNAIYWCNVEVSCLLMKPQHWSTSTTVRICLPHQWGITIIFLKSHIRAYVVRLVSQWYKVHRGNSLPGWSRFGYLTFGWRVEGDPRGIPSCRSLSWISIISARMIHERKILPNLPKKWLFSSSDISWIVLSSLFWLPLKIPHPPQVPSLLVGVGSTDTEES